MSKDPANHHSKGSAGGPAALSPYALICTEQARRRANLAMVILALVSLGLAIMTCQIAPFVSFFIIGMVVGDAILDASLAGLHDYWYVSWLVLAVIGGILPLFMASGIGPLLNRMLRFDCGVSEQNADIIHSNLESISNEIVRIKFDGQAIFFSFQPIRWAVFLVPLVLVFGWWFELAWTASDATRVFHRS